MKTFAKLFLAIAVIAASTFTNKAFAQDSQYSPVLQIIKQSVVNPATPTLTAQINTAYDNAFKTYVNTVSGKTLALRISQTGTSAPTIDTTLTNTFGATPVFAYSGVGIYTISGLVNTSQKNLCEYTVTNGVGATVGIVQVAVIASNLIQIKTFDMAGAASNAVLNECFFRLRLLQ